MVKVLLLNDIRPFVLATPLKADLAIGVDVKNDSAGFTAVSRDANLVTFEKSTSRNKEQLGRGQVRKFIRGVVERFATGCGYPLENILIHRDGRLFQPEIAGIHDAIGDLKKQGVLSDTCGCSFIEIPKSYQSPVRLFEVLYLTGRQDETVRNPVNGTCMVLGKDAYMVTTGYPFRHKGTCNPLHVVWKGGKMSFADALQDTFSLSNLTWTKIDDCLRVPLTTKYGDMRLRETAGEYDENSFEFESEENGGKQNE